MCSFNWTLKKKHWNVNCVEDPYFSFKEQYNWIVFGRYKQFMSMVLSKLNRLWLWSEVIAILFTILVPSLNLPGVRSNVFIQAKIFHLPVTCCLAPLKRPCSLRFLPVPITVVVKTRNANKNRRLFISDTPIFSRNASMYRKPTWKVIRNNIYNNIYAEVESNVGPRGG